eukprot:TRINITY_DN13220_c0_g1::TRINITY_DN13220_c0_g1_i1::g.31069::m.31069 TRINITY_DN13220_c0_g1::TRINITY_DN13220_c0_g1_i1::g.31069  ORF type:complete len:129 (+),score=24.77,sp/B0BLT0/ZN593_XENTR/53.66/1e-24,zf-C2H2_jaz/PF12171.3/1.8e-10,zf-met/PF12874.2/0.014,zf-C2H2/PF00096.21/0.027 TRINITY_DN13220_c0_g1_i1:64-450(+)
MGQPSAKRKKTSRKGVEMKKSIRRKRMSDKPIEYVIEDCKPENSHKFEALPVDFELPGLGQYYCVECSRYFIDQKTLDEHKKTKVHKLRLKVLKEKPYSHAEAAAAAGMGAVDNGPKLRSQDKTMATD